MKASRPNDKVGRSIPSLPIAQLKGHKGPIHAVRFTNDGKYCITAGHDRTLRLYNPTRLDPAQPANPSYLPTHLQNNNNNNFSIPLPAIPSALPIQTYSAGHTHPPATIAIDDKSSTLLSSSDKILVVTDVLSGAVKRRYQGHVAKINAACCHSSELYISGSYDGTVRVWDGRSRDMHPVQVLNEAKDSIRAVVSTESEIITGGVDGIVRTYDLRRGEMRADEVWEGITDVSLTRDKRSVVVNRLDGSLWLLERETGELLSRYEGGHVGGRYGLECDVTARDECIVTGSEDGKVVLYDLMKGSVAQVLMGHGKAVCSVAAHPKEDKESVLISASYDGSAVVWANGEEALKWQS